MGRCVFCRRIVWPWQRRGKYASFGFFQTETLIVRYHARCV